MATIALANRELYFPVEPAQKPKEVELSVVLPCLNEAETIALCILKAQGAMDSAGVRGEIIVADNGSTDGSTNIAASLGAIVVHVQTKGYGSALMGGIAAARGRYVIMGDADASYDFTDIPRFIEKLRLGHDLVVGNRFQGGILPGAMPALHRYLGNPVLSMIGKLFFKSPCRDFHCGLRGFSKTAYERMALRTTGMEFASEMIVKASLLRMSACEVPTSLGPDGRNRAPHLRTWRDGWRHLRFLLLYSPRWLFLYPGMALMMLGVLVGAWLLPGPRRVGRVIFDVHTLLYATVAILLGFQAIAFAVFTKLFVVAEGLHPPLSRLGRLSRFISLELGLLAGSIVTAIGLAGSIYAMHIWSSVHFGPLEISRTLRIAIPASLFLTLGVQSIFFSFFLSVLRLRRQ
jgi:glycosyltransferase involved in cell wall biosynthesis